ncbi:MAG: GAF domain-containing protein, partial [Proteobacteria bacterium]
MESKSLLSLEKPEFAVNPLSVVPKIDIPTHVPPAAVLDPARLKALYETGLMDSDAEDCFDRLTRIATTVFKAPVALVSLVDDKRQFFKSQCGLPESWKNRRETPVSQSFCQYVVAEGQPLVIPDSADNALVCNNEIIQLLDVVAYLGVPIKSSDGKHTFGSFCVIDNVPRDWTDADVALLTDLAQSVVTEIEVRSYSKAREEACLRFLTRFGVRADFDLG